MVKINDANYKRKVLVICQYYYPEPFRITDICEELVKRGHEVHVVTGYPNYPEGIIYEGYGKGKRIDEVINGVSVHRCFTIPRGKGLISRFLNYYSYVISSTRYVKSKMCRTMGGKSFDVVFCNQLSPVMMAKAAVVYSKKNKVPHVLYCLDLWPESLIVGGVKRGSFVYKYYHKVSEKLYNEANKILVTSKMFIEYLNSEFGVDTKKMSHLPQYAEGLFECCSEDIKKPNFEFTFAGNLGEAQSVDTILYAAALLGNEPIHIKIIGNGSKYTELKNLKEKLNLENVSFLGRKPIEEMPRYYKESDAMLITLDSNPILSMTLPGKIQTYMAAGKPIIGAIDGEAKRVIEEAECGLCGNASDAMQLANNIRMFIGKGEMGISEVDRERMGRMSRRYYDKFFSKENYLSELEEVLKGDE